MKISGRSFYLRSLVKKDLSKEYFSWLKDQKVNQFLDVRFSHPSKKQAEANLAKYDNKTSFFFGVFDKLEFGRISRGISNQRQPPMRQGPWNKNQATKNHFLKNIFFRKPQKSPPLAQLQILPRRPGQMAITECNLFFCDLT